MENNEQKAESDVHRLFVKNLLEEHSAIVNAVKSNIQNDPLYDAVRYDDLWVLRFVLSKKTESKATKAAISTMKYREEYNINAFGDMRRKFFHPQQDHDLDVVVKKYLYCNPEWVFTLYLPDEDKSLIQVIDVAKANMKKMAATLTKEDILHVYRQNTECLFQILDDITRRTGRLTKLCRILKLGDEFSVRSLSPTYSKLESIASKRMQDYYPQLLGSVLVIDAPSTVGAVWRVMKHLFPRSVVEKLDFIYPTKREKDMKPLMKYASKEHLPNFLGGKREVWPPTEQRTTSNAFM